MNGDVIVGKLKSKCQGHHEFQASQCQSLLEQKRKLDPSVKYANGNVTNAGLSGRMV
jgi:hypothetical protein